MKIHEYQAKEILREYGVPVPRGGVASTKEEVRKIAEELGGTVIVKAQIHAGGRGKGGGVKLAANADEAEEHAGNILGMNLVTHQTGAEGKEVQKVLIEEGIDIAQELYFGIVLDRVTGQLVLMASKEGGVEIEKVAAENPDAIMKEHIEPSVGIQPFQLRKLAFGLGLKGDAFREATRFFSKLIKAYEANDSSLVEINPLVITADDKVIALDAKMNFDDNALYKHKNIMDMRDLTEEDPYEVEASKFDLNYIKLDGNIGCMVNGAGLAMATMDIIKLSGGEPANFLDVGGAANVTTVENGFKILMSDKTIKAVLINIFGGIVRCDVVAKGVVEAAKNVKIDVPLIVRLEGTNAKEGREILENSSIDINVASDFSEGAQKAVELAKA
ncbi:ADP-forming succinate--CoA ligase subunit beta [Candidatus Marinimicrobia bacterium MT.SAG.3]|nr:ADP-forming succinate--CoA ligase subunit beta [Candidatus Marinimicrobia bacterium MT.SAG.3]